MPSPSSNAFFCDRDDFLYELPGFLPAKRSDTFLFPISRRPLGFPFNRGHGSFKHVLLLISSDHESAVLNELENVIHHFGTKE